MMTYFKTAWCVHLGNCKLYQLKREVQSMRLYALHKHIHGVLFICARNKTIKSKNMGVSLTHNNEIIIMNHSKIQWHLLRSSQYEQLLR